MNALLSYGHPLCTAAAQGHFTEHPYVGLSALISARPNEPVILMGDDVEYVEYGKGMRTDVQAQGLGLGDSG